MSNDVFGANNNLNANDSGDDNIGFDLHAVMGISSNHSSASEQVEKLLETYEKIQSENPKGFPQKMITLRPDWIGDKELVVMFTEANGKLAITPILFGGEPVSERVRDSNDRVLRAASYNLTKWEQSKKDAPADECMSKFLRLCVRELQDGNHIGKLTNHTRKCLDLAGCIVVTPESKIDPLHIISAAISEMRACLWGLHGTANFTAKEQDMNYLNYSHVKTIVDLTTEPQATDLLGNNLFAPLKIRLAHNHRDELSGTGGEQLKTRLEVFGYLDFRPLTQEEMAKYAAANTNAPFLIPQFIMTGLNNVRQGGVVTPSILLDALAGIHSFEGDGMAKMYEQCAQYATTVDTACNTYDWNQLGILIAIEAQARGIAIPGAPTAMDPVTLLTGEKNPTPVQRSNAYKATFGPMEILVDTPQSGEMAKVRQMLLSDLSYYHHKLTGKQNKVVQALGAGGLVPQGDYTRVSEKAQERRDSRETLNTLGMMTRFHHGNLLTDNFIKGSQHMLGRRILENSNADKDYRERFTFINEVTFDDGSFKLRAESQRVFITSEYLTQLRADLDDNGVVYEQRNSGAELIARISSPVANTSSLNFQDIY